MVLDLRGIAGADEAAALAVAALFLDEPLELDEGLTVTPNRKRAYGGALEIGRGQHVPVSSEGVAPASPRPTFRGRTIPFSASTFANVPRPTV